jgi:hypothetical protein
VLQTMQGRLTCMKMQRAVPAAAAAAASTSAFSEQLLSLRADHPSVFPRSPGYHGCSAKLCAALCHLSLPHSCAAAPCVYSCLFMQFAWMVLYCVSLHRITDTGHQVPNCCAVRVLFCSHVRVQLPLHAVRVDGAAAQLPSAGLPREQRDGAAIPAEQVRGFATCFVKRGAGLVRF